MKHPPQFVNPSLSRATTSAFRFPFVHKLILLAPVLLLLALSVAPVQAAEFNVNSQAALNSAIQSANAALDEDTINITGDITLSGDLLTIFGVTIINGNGHTINGGGQHTAITMGGSHGNVTIKNLTLAQNKGATSYHGGAIYYPSGVSLTLDNVTIRNSATSDATADGGGLYCAAGNLTIRNSRIHGNSGREGGGIYLGNGCTNAQISNSSIYDNDSAGGTVSLGGGFTRPKSGGGIHVAGGASVTISNSRIYGNTAGTADMGANGGGIGVYASSSSAATVNINSSSIYNNLAYGSGGGLYMNGRTTLNVSGSAFYGNEAKASGGAGGGLMLKNELGSAATHTITNTSIFNNRAAGRGGGLSASMNFQGTTSAVTLRHVTISGNTSSLAGTHQGGGLYATQTVVTLSNSIVFGNTADGSAGNCIFSGLPTPSQSAQLTPRLAHNIVGAGSTGSSAPHCTTNGDPSDPQLVAPSVHGQGNFFIPRLGSPAIDTVPNASCLSSVTTDQRGQPRPFPTGGNCDKGAIEHAGYVPPPPGGSGGPGGPGGSGGSDGGTGKIMTPAETCADLMKMAPAVEVSNAAGGTACQEVEPAGYGHPDLTAEKPDSVVDVWGDVQAGTQVCFQGTSGKIRYVDTSNMKRTITTLSTFTKGNMICATISGPGQVALIQDGSAPGGQAPAAQEAEAPEPAQQQAQQQAPASQGLGGCMVKTQGTLNFRKSPAGERLEFTDPWGNANSGWLPGGVTLTALERSGNWLKVDYYGTQGWVSAAYVTTSGSCG